MKKVIITTGGTGGHIYPALSVAEELLKRECEVVFVGSNTRMENEIVEKAGLPFIGLDIKPGKSIKNILKIIFLTFKCIGILIKERPSAVIGFGNYISIPMCLAAVITRRKLYLQEQNANIGVTNKVLSCFAKRTFLAFETTYDMIPIKNQHKFKVTGNPLRKEIYQINKQEERKALGIEASQRVLVVTGGSLGAKSINQGMMKYFDELKEEKNLKVYWATGKNHYEDVIKEIDVENSNIIVKPYFENLIHIMGAADLVVCRAGALTISEIIELEKPSILIPYNSVKVGQGENAQILKDREGAFVYSDKDTNEAIEFSIGLIENDHQLDNMKNNIKSLKLSRAEEIIVENLGIWRQN